MEEVIPRMHGNVIDLTGKRFGRWSVQSYAGGKFWNCLCDCGSTAKVQSNPLRVGSSKSCGCLRITHAKTNSPEYYSWASMHQRCGNPAATSFDRYGGRGIKVCERWSTFSKFYADMGERPEGTTLDRIDQNGHYSPDNCRWATASRQAINRRTTHLIAAFGRTRSLSEWASASGIKPQTIRARLNAGYPAEVALTRTVQRSK